MKVIDYDDYINSDCKPIMITLYSNHDYNPYNTNMNPIETRYSVL